MGITWGCGCPCPYIKPGGDYHFSPVRHSQATAQGFKVLAVIIKAELAAL